MRDFNTVKEDLIRHLRLSCQSLGGQILWYEGTLECLFEFLEVINQNAVMSDHIGDANEMVKAEEGET